GLQQVLMVKGRLSEEFVAALLLQGHKAALNRTDAGRGDISVLSLEILGCLAHMLKHGLKIFQVEEKKALVIGDLEHQRQHAGLGVVEIQNTAEQERPHLRDRGSHRMALLAEDIPERDRATGEGKRTETQVLHPFLQLGIVFSGLAYAGEI